MDEFQKNGMEEKGIAHVIAAFRYSLAGGRVLFREEAARLELIFLLVAGVLFFVVGAAFYNYAVLVGLFILLLCVEALNTALELIVDKTSPEISDYGKQTKDLGSFAVMCALFGFGGYALWVILPL